MCGLFSNRKMAAEVKALFRFDEDVPFAPRAYIAPGGPIEIVRADHNERHFAIVRWGLVPGWAKQVRTGRPLINARAETVLEKPSFKSGMKHRRCLIPADGYFEWTGSVPGKKQPWHITRPDDQLFAFAGIWEHWMSKEGSELESAAIITTVANDTLQQIHDRMPVVIHKSDYDQWLDTDHVMAEKAAKLLCPAPQDYFTFAKTTIDRRPQKPKPQVLPDSKPDQLSLF